MDKVSIVGLGEIKTKKYGTVKIFKRKDVCGAYFVIGKNEKKKIAGLVSKEGKEIIPLCEAVLEDYNINEDNKNAYLGFRYKDSPLIDYYIIKDFDGETIVTKTFGRKNKLNVIFKTTDIKCNVWPIQLVDNSQYVLYNFKEDRIVSMAFDDLLEQDTMYHKFYYEINLASNFEENGEKGYYIHSKLCGFLDENGYMSSRVLDTESLNTYQFQRKFSTNSNEFINFVNNMMIDYTKKYDDKEEKFSQEIYKLFENPDPYTNKAKIIEFKAK